MTADEREHVRLSWWLIERKIAYYYPELVHPSWLDDVITPDDEYDAAEIRYLELCRKLGLPNTVVHKGYPGFDDYEHAMGEVDMKRPSVQLAVAKLKRDKKERG